MARYRDVTVKVPGWMSTKKLQSEVDMLVEERYGRISVNLLRKRLGIKKLRSNIRITKAEEKQIARLRESERTRVRQA